MTRFVAHLHDDEVAAIGVTCLVVGQQNLSVVGGKSSTLFGLGSVAKIKFPLEMRDPWFKE
jgi:hypothetical protein